MIADGTVWRADTAEESVGEILIEEADFPWLAGRFTAGPGFDAVQDFFAREFALMGLDDEHGWAEWESVYEEIRARVSLSSPEGPVPEFLLHIEGDRAWFRWSDEPFEDA